MHNVVNDNARTWFCVRMTLQSLACAALLLTALAPAQAQFFNPNQTLSKVEEDMRAQATSANIQTWLASKDPRLIAWGAYFARENNDTDALDHAAQLVHESLYQTGPGLLSDSGPQYAALSEVLDALIEKRVLLSAEMLRYVYRYRPVQAMVLLSMLPAAVQTENLEQWYYGPRSDISRVSAMLLSKLPPAGFAANVMGNSEERLIIHIAVPVGGTITGFGGGSGGGVCVDSWPPSRLDGWPELFSYRLHENDNTSADPLLVEAGGDRITWERAPEGRFRSCGAVGSLTIHNRHHLLAEMLGERDAAMPWQARKDVTIYKESDEQVKREIGAAILAERAVLLQSVQEFRAKGLISAEEAKSALPKLSITIQYEDALDNPE